MRQVEKEKDIKFERRMKYQLTVGGGGGVGFKNCNMSV